MIYRFEGITEDVICPCLYFYKNDRVAVSRNNIDLADRGLIVSRDDVVAFLLRNLTATSSPSLPRADVFIAFESLEELRYALDILYLFLAEHSEKFPE